MESHCDNCLRFLLYIYILEELMPYLALFSDALAVVLEAAMMVR